MSTDAPRINPLLLSTPWLWSTTACAAWITPSALSICALPLTRTPPFSDSTTPLLLCKLPSKLTALWPAIMPSPFRIWWPWLWMSTDAPRISPLLLSTPWLWSVATWAAWITPSALSICALLLTRTPPFSDSTTPLLFCKSPLMLTTFCAAIVPTWLLSWVAIFNAISCPLEISRPRLLLSESALTDRACSAVITPSLLSVLPAAIESAAAEAIVPWWLISNCLLVFMLTSPCLFEMWPRLLSSPPVCMESASAL